MKYARDEDSEEGGVGTLEPWEFLVVDAVGNVIDFWQFKRNQGRVWALLYLRGAALSALEIQTALGLSKGAVSMLLRELEQWGVIIRVRSPSSDVWRYAAELELMKMIGHVIDQREAALVSSVKSDFERAERMIKERGDVPAPVRDRVRRMRMLAGTVDRALKTFLATARLDVVGALALLSGRDSGRAERR
jgi:DNA-binding transcriptional regulator GbsR (MarR family)